MPNEDIERRLQALVVAEEGQSWEDAHQRVQAAVTTILREELVKAIPKREVELFMMIVHAAWAQREKQIALTPTDVT